MQNTDRLSQLIKLRSILYIDLLVVMLLILLYFHRSSRHSQRTKRSGATACCIFTLLILGALLIAIGMGVMAYYLLRDRK